MKPRMSEYSDASFFRETGTLLRNLWNRLKFVMGTIYEYVDLFLRLTELAATYPPVATRTCMHPDRQISHQSAEVSRSSRKPAKV
jgi:hypothetical protein